MDPIGASASLITLLDVIITTFKTVKKLTRSYRNIAAEVIILTNELDALNTQLLLLRHVQVALSKDTFSFTEVEYNCLNDFLQDTHRSFEGIHAFLRSHVPKTKVRGKSKWAFREEAEVKEWLSKLQNLSSRLNGMMLLLNIHYSSTLQSSVKLVNDTISAMETRSRPLKIYERHRFRWAWTTMHVAWTLPLTARLQASIVSCEENNQPVYNISLRIHTLFYLRALWIDLQVQGTSLFPPGFSLTSIKSKNIVSATSEIMTASANGHVAIVAHLILSGKASVDDITPDNSSPLRYAIESGSTDLVSFLLSQGADAKGVFGQLQTSPLEWAIAARKIDIARLLISKGADVHHISARGWTPTFNLFGSNQIHHSTPGSCQEYLEMLSSASFADFDAQDAEGWSCMHRAAAYGNSDDITRLVRRNSSTLLRTGKLLWTPIFCAVQFGNMSTFKKSREYHPEFLSVKDIRGWTLLHVAVNAGRIQIMKELLRLGADLHCRSVPWKVLVPTDLVHLSITPIDIAKVRGEVIFKELVNALKERGHDVQIVNDEKDELDELDELF